MIAKYGVAFKGYRCNIESVDNGTHQYEKEFNNVSDAVDFAILIRELINKGDYLEEDYDFLDLYNIDYVTEYIGTYMR